MNYNPILTNAALNTVLGRRRFQPKSISLIQPEALFPLEDQPTMLQKITAAAEDTGRPSLSGADCAERSNIHKTLPHPVMRVQGSPEEAYYSSLDHATYRQQSIWTDFEQHIRNGLKRTERARLLYRITFKCNLLRPLGWRERVAEKMDSLFLRMLFSHLLDSWVGFNKQTKCLCEVVGNIMYNKDIGDQKINGILVLVLKPKC